MTHKTCSSKENILSWWKSTLSEENRRDFTDFYFGKFHPELDYSQIKAIFYKDVTKEPSYLYK